MSDRLTRWLPPLFCAALFAALATATWRALGDVDVDFGTELYLAWRLHVGDALYRDIAYRNGPLSPLVNAGWFGLLGVSLRSLLLANLGILAGSCALVYALLARMVDRFAAAGAVAVFLACFGFAHLVEIGNYSWVAPYQHAQTHGVLLAFGMLAAFRVLLQRASLSASFVAGACLGLAFLTKTEIFVPVAAVFGVGSAALFLAAPPEARRHALVALVVAASVVFGFWGLLAREIGAAEAARGVIGNWAYLGGSLLDDPFYRRGMGFNAPLGNLAAALLAAAVVTVFVAVGAGVDRFLHARGSRLGPPIVLLVTAGWAASVPPSTWLSLGRGLPILMVGVGCVFGWIAWHERSDRTAFARATVLGLWALLGFALLGKILLRARFGQYGFSLALPATLLLAAILLGVIPAWLARHGASGSLARGMAAVALLALMSVSTIISHRWIDSKTVQVGTGADALWAEPRRGAAIVRTLAFLEKELPEEGTLLVVPEGVGLNYWLRRKLPGRHYLFLPTELDSYGGDVVLAEVKATPPDAVVVFARNYWEFERGQRRRSFRYGIAIARHLVSVTELVDAISPDEVAAGALRVEIRMRPELARQLGSTAGP